MHWPPNTIKLTEVHRTITSIFARVLAVFECVQCPESGSRWGVVRKNKTLIRAVKNLKW